MCVGISTVGLPYKQLTPFTQYDGTKCCERSLQLELQQCRRSTTQSTTQQRPQLTLASTSSASAVSPVCLPSLLQTCAAPAQLCCRTRYKLRRLSPSCVRKLCNTMHMADGRGSPCASSLTSSSFGSLCRQHAERKSTTKLDVLDSIELSHSCLTNQCNSLAAL